MGKIKDQILKEEEQEPTVMPLKEEEFNYIAALNQARNNIVQEYGAAMSAFLHYITVSRGLFESTDQLKFELDFDDDGKRLKIWKLEDNFFKEESVDK